MKRVSFIPVFLFLFTAGICQIEQDGIPLSLSVSLKSAVPVMDMPVPVKSAIRDFESRSAGAMKPFLFAFPTDTLIPLLRHGSLETTPAGDRILRLTIRSKGAYSINLIFDRFLMGRGTRVFLISEGNQVIRGAFTSDNQLINGWFPTIPIPGEQATVEVDIPAWSKDVPDIRISKVSHDFTGALYGKGSRTSGSCNVDINCPAGAAWQIEKKAVVKFIRGGAWLCSGSLINTTANAGRALLYTANHCIGSQSHAQQSVFFFMYEKPGCATGSGNYSHTMSGSRLLATYNSLDFTLVELSTVPPQSYEPYYAGWDRRIVTYHDTVVTIHHPNGDVKKISKSYHRVVTGDFGSGFDSNTHWKISQWDLGTTEPGSSGAPLFNTDHKIIGDLTGGDASCDYNYNDYFQKFNICWDRYPDSSNQLKYWLDPLMNGASVINGYDPFLGGKPLANFDIRPHPAQVGRKIYLTDRSTGQPVQWTWLLESGIPEFSKEQNPPELIYNESGFYQIMLTVVNDLGIDSIRQSIEILDHGDYSVSETRVVPGRIIRITDLSTGNPLSVKWMIPGANPSGYLLPGDFEISFNEPGDYSMTQIVEYNDFTDTLVHYNQFRVLSDVLVFSSHIENNVPQNEHTRFVSYGAQGNFPGSNSLGIRSLAEEFRNRDSKSAMITGFSFPVEYVSGWADDYYLTCGIWNGKWQIMTRDSIKISDLVPGSRYTVRFKVPVNFDTVVYAGYELNPMEEGFFISKAAVDRGEKGKGTAYARTSSWSPVSDVLGLHTSLDISLETSTLSNAFVDQIKVRANGNYGNFTLDLGELVFSRVEISLFDMTGKQVSTVLTKPMNQVMFDFMPPSSGIYLLKVRIDYYELTTKVLILKK